ncbi:hypothetical protein [Vibrio agarivorans]|uniref:hypothetical protein n=1 Tax=Vibrio agarivorans TaxID=153622 RepID=UPI00222F83B5|nr:hypothetical protein [Vibrio agarivorans]MDN3660170.1 hypothetical protein [Vibrio agarivorans]
MNQLHKPIEELLANVSNQDKGRLSLKDLLDAEAKYLRTIERFLNYRFPQSSVTFSASDIDRDRMISIGLVNSNSEETTSVRQRISEQLIQEASQGLKESIDTLKSHIDALCKSATLKGICVS